jgi:predicted RNA-binding protein YlxR (DUF448 family)
MSRPVLRTCVGCRTVRDRGELVRLAFDPAEGLIVNPLRARGRGAYLCPSIACLEKAWHRRVFPRAFRRDAAGFDGAAVRERFEAEIRPIARERRNGLSHPEREMKRSAPLSREKS